MVQYPNTCKLVALMLLYTAFVSTASADIYMNDIADTEEIRISNIPSEYGDQTLIFEPSTSPEDQAPSSQITANHTIEGMPFADAVSAAAKDAALDPALLHAVIAVESGHNPKAISPRGAQGLMQLMPATSRRFGLSNPYDPVQNIRAGARYLGELRDLFKGDLALTLAAYNAGPNAVIRHGSHIPPFEETRSYVPKVLKIYRVLTNKSM